MAKGVKTGGRQKGTPNKRTQAAQAKAAEVAKVIVETLPGAFDGDAHAFLMSVYKDPGQELAARLDAAGKAIRYEKPALSSVDGTGEAVRNAVVRLPPKAGTADEWQKQYAPSQTRN